MVGIRSRLVPDLESGRYTDREWERYHHLDLPHAEIHALYEELSALQPLVYLMRRDLATATTNRCILKARLAWVLERVGELKQEIGRRRYATDKPLAAKRTLAGGVTGMKL